MFNKLIIKFLLANISQPWLCCTTYAEGVLNKQWELLSDFYLLHPAVTVVSILVEVTTAEMWRWNFNVAAAVTSSW